MQNTPVNQPIVLVSSGNASGIDLAEALSTGSAGARAAEEFLRYGYHVVFLHAEASLVPFTTRLPGGSNLTDGLSLGKGGALCFAFADDAAQRLLVADVHARESTKGKGALLCVPFIGAAHYLSLLRTATTELDAALALRSRLVLYLAAVSPKAAHEGFLGREMERERDRDRDTPRSPHDATKPKPAPLLISPAASPPASPARQLSPSGRKRRPSVVVTEFAEAAPDEAAPGTATLLEQSFDEDHEEEEEGEGEGDDNDDEESEDDSEEEEKEEEEAEEKEVKEKESELKEEKKEEEEQEKKDEEKDKQAEEEEASGVQLSIQELRFHVENLAQRWAPSAYQFQCTHTDPLADPPSSSPDASDHSDLLGNLVPGKLKLSTHATDKLPEVDAVAVGYLKWVMRKQQFHIHGTMNQFRNQALAGTEVGAGLYRGRQEQLEDASLADALEGDDGVDGDGEAQEEKEAPARGEGSRSGGDVWVPLGTLVAGALIGFAVSFFKVGALRIRR